MSIYHTEHDAPEWVTRCRECAGANVQILAWVNPNTDSILDGYTVDASGTWCNDCEGHTGVSTEQAPPTPTPKTFWDHHGDFSPLKGLAITLPSGAAAPVYYEAGPMMHAVWVDLGDGLECWATPDHETADDNATPCSIETQDGEILSDLRGEAVLTWTGDEATDCKTWADFVTAHLSIIWAKLTQAGARLRVEKMGIVVDEPRSFEECHGLQCLHGLIIEATGADGQTHKRTVNVHCTGNVDSVYIMHPDDWCTYLNPDWNEPSTVCVGHESPDGAYAETHGFGAHNGESGTVATPWTGDKDQDIAMWRKVATDWLAYMHR